MGDFIFLLACQGRGVFQRWGGQIVQRSIEWLIILSYRIHLHLSLVAKESQTAQHQGTDFRSL